ncbi:MAG: SAM-dependent methyltransferase [Deltaproteobacteria bacterium HGW-Deltaproteobacteria-10]|nr:MAG: SAM-dependent methyltransferase [Deltaproteobacteria bacterium HGW-Deltaproteobacteria-10]
MDEETLDEIIDGRLRVFQKKRGYRFSLDAILLAHFVSLKAKSKAIDLGTGSGIIPLVLATRFPNVAWTGLEIQTELAELANKSIELNCLQNHINIVFGDARKIKNIFPEHSFDAVTFNPPYRKINSGRINPDQEKAVARHEISGSLKEFLLAAKYLLKPAGKVFTIYPAKRLAHLVSLFRANSIEPKRMKFVFSDDKSVAEFVLVEGRAGAREELKIEPSLVIYGEDKMYTTQMNSIFSDLA